MLKNHSNFVLDPPGELSVEVAVVGSGPGGCVTTEVLSREIDDVCLLESGGFYPPDRTRKFSRETMVNQYRNAGMTFSVNSLISYVEGKCVGGGSEVNSALYDELPKEIFEEWKTKYHLSDLKFREIKGYYKEIKKKLNVQYLPYQAPKSSYVLKHGGERMGWETGEAPRWYRYDSNQASGQQQTMTRTYLPEALNNGAKLIANTIIRTIQTSSEGVKITGSYQGEKITIHADSLFICCGSTQTPNLLRKNNLGINVGNSIKLHPFFKVTARFEDDVNPTRLGVGVHQINEFGPRLKLGCAISTPAHIASNLVDYPDQLNLLKEDPNHFASFYVRLRGGDGSMTFLPGCDDPLIQYSLSRQERKILVQGVKNLSRCLLSGGAKEVFPNLSPGGILRTSADVKKISDTFSLSDSRLTSVHLFSSCPMRGETGSGTVDSYGKLRGHENIYLSDSSILPDSPGSNPQATIMALAYRNAHHFLNKQS